MQNKVVIIGAGFVGATTAYALMNNGIASEIVLIDIDHEKAEGEAMDLSHGASFVKPVNIRAGGYEECEDADLIIITAGANQKPGESRLDLVKRNTGIFKQIISNITDYTQDAILLVVTNPVDILTYVSYKLSGYPRNKVIGSGTVLDTSRFRYLLSKHCEVNPSNIHAYILGEHGDHEVAAWSMTNIAGVDFDRYCDMCKKECEIGFKEKIYEKVRDSAYEVIDRKGATYYAIGLSTVKIVESIFRDENSILTVSSVLEGNYGLDKIAFSLPTKVGRSGVKKVIDLNLNEEEEKALKESGEVLKGIIEELDI